MDIRVLCLLPMNLPLSTGNCEKLEGAEQEKLNAFQVTSFRVSPPTRYSRFIAYNMLEWLSLSPLPMSLMLQYLNFAIHNSGSSRNKQYLPHHANQQAVMCLELYTPWRPNLVSHSSRSTSPITLSPPRFA